jgi:predicted esterase
VRRTRPLPRLALAALVAVALLAPRAPLLAGDDAAPALPKWKAGVQEGTVPIDGREEGFVALVPEGYSPKKPRALVLLLHGNGGKAADFLQVVRPHVGKSAALWVSLERCDNRQQAVGYAPKYLESLRAKFAVAEGKVFALGFSGGGFRLWDDVVGNADVVSRFRGVVCVGSGRQNLDAAEKPAQAPTVVLVGDPKDGNFGEPGPAAERTLAERGYETIVLEHAQGHSMPPAEVKDVCAWIEAVAAGKKAALSTRRLEGAAGKKR